jgi:hypothetical protein
MLRFQTGLQVQKIWILRWISETIRENIKISAKATPGYYELKKHKPWFDKGCSELLDQRKQAKFQWLQHPCKINGDNLNNVRCKASRNF